MTKKSFIRCVLPFIFIAGFLFFMPNLTFSAQPGLDLNYDGTGVHTWTSDAESPFTGLSHWVKVVDYDGIADDGSSHTVTVTYPDGSTVKTLAFNYEMDANSTIYEMYDSDISQPIDSVTYSGNYVYRVTEVSSGDWTEATDYLEVDPVNPPDETTFSPNFDSPQSINTHFDDVYVNNTLHDDFESGFDPSKWTSQPSEVTYEGGEVRFEQTYNPGRGSRWMYFTNPEGINTIQATVRVDSVSSNRPRARIGGYFCRDSYGDVYAQVGLRGGEAVYGVDTEHWEGDHLTFEDLVPLTSLGVVTQGNNYDISIDWDGTTFTFRVVGLNDSVNYSTTYVPSGILGSPNDPWKAIGLGCWIVVDSTTPTFSWDEVAGGATYYRVRIYGLNNNTIYRGYTKSLSYTLPPGILKPNAVYKYRVEALNHHQWFEWDNFARSDRDKTRFITGPDEAQNPYVDLWSSGVSTWTDQAPFGTNTWFYIRIHDAQGVPGNIDSVKALLPDGATETILYLDYNKSDTCGVYRGVYFGDIQKGTYTFTVVDKDGNSDTSTEVLTSNPIGYPREASLQPANNTLIGETGVSFNWGNVSGAATYELSFYDKDLNNLFDIYTTESEYTLPPGILKEESLYRYRIHTRREFFEDNADNGSTVPSGSVWNANTFFTTETNGSATPSLNLDSYGVAVWHVPHPLTGSSVYWLDFYSMVTDSDGVPENIEKVEVIYPDGATTRLLKYEDMLDWEANYYDYEIYTDPSLIPSGTYTFRVVDFDGNEVTLQDELPDVASNILPWVTGVTPADGTFTTITPTIAWDSISGASYYKVRIMSSWAYPTVHWSDKLTQTQYTVPDGILSLNTIYGYRIYAYRENEVDFYSCNHSWHSANYRFTTQQDAPTVTTGDATSVTTNSATLNGTVNPYGVSTTYYFEYGTTTSYGSNTASTDAGSGTIDVSVNSNITGLSDNTTYHFRIVAANSKGTTNGNDATFTTASGDGGGGGFCFITTTGYDSSME